MDERNPHNKSLAEAIEFAAKELPEGTSIGVFVEPGSTWVTAELDGSAFPIGAADSTLAEQVLEAITWVQWFRAALPVGK